MAHCRLAESEDITIGKLSEGSSMSWQFNEIRPPEPPPRKELQPSFAIVRLFGAVGFTGTGVLASKVAPRLFGMNHDLWNQPEWSAGTVALLVGCILAALVGMLFGIGIAASIRVKSDRVDYGINAVWQYLANSSIAAFVLWPLILVKLFGKNGSKQFVQDQGEVRSFLVTIGISASACVIAGVALALAGSIGPNRRAHFVPCLVLAAPITLVAAYAQFALLALESKYWIFLGIALPAVVIPFSASSMRRDEVNRRKWSECHGNGNSSGRPPLQR